DGHRLVMVCSYQDQRWPVGMRVCPASRHTHGLIQLDHIPDGSGGLIRMRFLIDERSLNLQCERLVSRGTRKDLNRFPRHVVEERLVCPFAEVRERLTSRPRVGAA